MEIAQKLLFILVAEVFIENFVLTKFLGICPFLGVSKKISSSLSMGLAVMAVMVCAAIFTYPVYTFVLVPLNIAYMNTIMFILIIALFVQIMEMALKKYFSPLYKALGVYLPLITTNCAILGVTLLNVNNEYGFLLSVFNSFCAGLGFLMVMLIFSGIRERVERSDVPESLKGTPITLIAAAIVSLSFIGFGGMAG
ncbi:MAG: RnfABCDGE type electron transport complex subunit A [Oscillospiraceae bacterium]|jgi:electron transport complex protein RnfA|nr:RnfABCDGE type electron transport complex subunit A [Oscillospiraceae bacterium]